ncbi:hypothetical protein ACIBO2_56360 [Nonomuraea sp. NPDC050022]|uniref:hypothetical protein n=1 Tax=Nonomuraea sp. NPDC050022 TaxID=3364358 RepID=UPI00379F494F
MSLMVTHHDPLLQVFVKAASRQQIHGFAIDHVRNRSMLCDGGTALCSGGGPASAQSTVAYGSYAVMAA